MKSAKRHARSDKPHIYKARHGLYRCERGIFFTTGNTMREAYETMMKEVKK